MRVYIVKVFNASRMHPSMPVTTATYRIMRYIAKFIHAMEYMVLDLMAEAEHGRPVGGAAGVARNKNRILDAANAVYTSMVSERACVCVSFLLSSVYVAIYLLH